MNTTRTTRRQSSTKSQAPAAPSGFAQQFEEMPDPLSVVEHLTIAGFLRRVPHRFHMDEILRFGDKVGKIAESLQVSYLTTIDRQLGQVRLFPVPLLVRVYQVLAAQFGWEPMNEVRALEDAGAETLRAHERTRKRLEAVAGDITEPAVAQALQLVLNWLENDAKRLRGEGVNATPPVELRPV